MRRAAGALWAFRARVELEAEARFRRIAADLARVGSPAPVVMLAEKAAREEARHHVLCATAAARFGADVRRGSAEAAPTAPGLPQRERVLHEAVAMCCITETVSAALLTEMLRETGAPGGADRVAGDPAIHAVVREVLRDEVQHARIGWGHLAYEAGRGDVGFIGEMLPGMLDDTVADEVFAPSVADDIGHALLPYGGLPRETRRAVFAAAIRQLVLPGLAQHGIDTGPARAWLDARVPPTA